MVGQGQVPIHANQREAISHRLTAWPLRKEHNLLLGKLQAEQFNPLLARTGEKRPARSVRPDLQAVTARQRPGSGIQPELGQSHVAWGQQPRVKDVVLLSIDCTIEPHQVCEQGH